MMRRGMIGFFVVLLVGSVIGWIFYVPTSFLCPLQAIPAYAQILSQNVVTDGSLSKFPMYGTDGAVFEKIWKQTFQGLAKNPLTLAVVPLGGRARRDTWIAICAAGPRVFWFRWRWMFFPPKGISPVRSYGAWSVWQLNDPMLPAWMRVRFALTEGLLICSFSDDANDIYYVLDTLDGRRPSMADRFGIMRIQFDIADTRSCQKFYENK